MPRSEFTSQVGNSKQKKLLKTEFENIYSQEDQSELSGAKNSHTRVFLDRNPYHFHAIKSKLPKTGQALGSFKKASKKIENFVNIEVLFEAPKEFENTVKITQLIVGRDIYRPSISAKKTVEGYTDLSKKVKNILLSNLDNAQPEWLHDIAGMFSDHKASFIATHACNRHMLEIEQFIASAYQSGRLSEITITPNITFIANTIIAEEIAYRFTAKMSDARYLEVNYRFNGLTTNMPAKSVHSGMASAISFFPVCSDSKPQFVSRDIFNVSSNLLNKFIDEFMSQQVKQLSL